MFGLLNDVFNLATNTVRIVVAPVEVVATLTNAAVKPVADVAETLVNDIRGVVK